MIDVYVCEPFDKQYVKTIENELKAFQQLVEGSIEVVSLGKYVIVCDEEAKLKQKKPSIHMDVDFIAGTSFFAKTENDQFLTTPTQQATGVLYSELLLIVHEVSSLKGRKNRFGKNNTTYYSVHFLRPELGTNQEY